MKGEEMQLVHMQSSLLFMFDLYKLKKLFSAVTGPCLQIPENRIQNSSSLSNVFRHPSESSVSGSFSPASSSETDSLYAEP